MIVGALVVVLAAGCAATPAGRGPGVAPAPLTAAVSARPRPRRERPSAPEVRPARPAPPVPAEPGAIALVELLARQMGPPPRGGVRRVDLSAVRNFSRCGPVEFGTFQRRLAELLSAAGRSRSIVFTAGGPADAQYTFSGTAYLINADGFDQWELFLALAPAGRSYTIWRSDGPLRLLRTPRAGTRQILRVPGPG